jgi:branched-subunit amino acid transport protein AzlD
MSILQPVSLTMILVVAAVKSITIPPSQQGTPELLTYFVIV